MSKERLQAARELIQQKRYDEARRILEGIDHPTAEKWLAQLPAGKPKSAARSGGVSGSLAVIGMIICLLVGSVGGFFIGRESLKAEIANAFNQAFQGVGTPLAPGPVQMTATAIVLTNEMIIQEVTLTAEAR